MKLQKSINNKQFSVANFAVIVTLLLFITGCSQSDNNTENSISLVPGDDNVSTFAVPKAIQALALPAGNLTGYVLIKDKNGNTVVNKDLTFNDQQTTATTSYSLNPGEYTLEIVFEFTSGTYTTAVTLALYTTPDPIIIEAGKTTIVNIDTKSYVLPDTDGDSVSNLAEVSNGTNPFDGTCILDESIIGNCKLG